MFDNYPEIMTVKQVAKALGIGLNGAYVLINTGQIASRKVGRKFLIPKSCVIDFMDCGRYTETIIKQDADYLSREKEVQHDRKSAAKER